MRFMTFQSPTGLRLGIKCADGCLAKRWANFCLSVPTW